MQKSFWSTLCLFSLLLTILLLSGPYSEAQPARPHTAIPASPLPDGMGVNIHFTDPRPGEMKMLAEAGFRWVRMDFTWGATEREKGKYDFAAYDRLMAALDEHQIKALFILDYANPLYDNNLAPHTEEGRGAFARWAAAAATHFKGRGILWEMWNEPNIGFWKPQPNVDDYIKLARATGEAIRAAAPGEAYIGPATSQIDTAFLEACFKGGLLEYWDAVSVHPYRQTAPETAAEEYRALRLLIAKYAPRGKRIPILSGEWGYSAAWSAMDEEKQGKMLPRQWLTNLSNDVPLSIWYDWHDDGPDPKEAEHHFGTVSFPHHENREPLYDPKPAYLAAKTLTSTLNGYRFNKRLVLDNPNDYLLLFSKGSAVRLVAWTTAPEPRPVIIPASAGRFAVTDHQGKVLPALTASRKGFAITLNDAPQYLMPEKPNDLLRIAAAWQRTQLEIEADGSRPVVTILNLHNPFKQPFIVRRSKLYPSTVKANTAMLLTEPGPGPRTYHPDAVLAGTTKTLSWAITTSREATVQPTRIELDITGVGRIAQETQIIITNPLRVRILPRLGNGIPVQIENPSGEALNGVLTVTGETADEVTARPLPLVFQTGATEQVLWLLLDSPVRDAYHLGLNLHDREGRLLLAVPPREYRAVDHFQRYTPDALPNAYRVVPDGDPQVTSEQTLAIEQPPVAAADIKSPVANLGALRLDYQFDAGWKFVQVMPVAEALQRIEGKPRELRMWIYGDGSGNLTRLRFRDATGQTFQPNGLALTWKGWKIVDFPLDGTKAGHWGGANDGVVHYPIRWDTLFLLDSATRSETSGTVYIGAPALVY